jgi:hypothetical protein
MTSGNLARRLELIMGPINPIAGEHAERCGC